MKKSRSIIAGLVILSFVVVTVFGAPLFTPYEPTDADSSRRLESFSFEHPFGTDRFGRDILSRTLYGGRTTLVSTFMALLFALVCGTVIGAISALNNFSILDMIMLRIMDVLSSFPFMIFAMMIAGLWGRGLESLLLSVIVVWWIPFARLSRSLALKAKTEEQVEASIILGIPYHRLVLFEIIPKAMASVFTLATFELGTLILSISALSFLGLGAQPPVPEWGSMLSDARSQFFTYPHLLFGPSLYIIMTVFALNLIGEGLRDRLDPYEGVVL